MAASISVWLRYRCADEARLGPSASSLQARRDRPVRDHLGDQAASPLSRRTVRPNANWGIAGLMRAPQRTPGTRRRKPNALSSFLLALGTIRGLVRIPKLAPIHGAAVRKYDLAIDAQGASR